MLLQTNCVRYWETTPKFWPQSKRVCLKEMAEQKNETKLWHYLKKSLRNIHFTRIESKTINGIPDLFGIYNGISFWCELKADKHSYPKLSKWQVSWINNYVRRGGVMLICNRDLLQRSLKLYRIQSWVDDPRSLVPDAVITANDPVALQNKFVELLD